MRARVGVKVIMYGVLVVMTALWLYPIGIAIYKSLAVGGVHNYEVVLNHPVFSYWHAIGNSFLLAGASALTIMVIASLGGFAFAKLRFRGRKVLYNALLACLAVPIAALITPLFFTIKSIGLRDTYTGVIIPLVAFNVLMMLMLMRNHFESLPDELIEAAKLDGASTFRTFRSVLVPLSGPALANVGVLSFVYSWNEYLLPTLLIRSPERFPVTQAISLLQFDRMSQEQISQMYAGLILMTIPSIIVYLFSQRYLQAGVTAGAVKA
ncbi:carbohydrate ABC transporter permease [Xylanimonas ulmi]|uniref:Carbohydrate ABC transporter membrane protein 2 (CUT1 family) n=1 Tax=Xylanimonas ulmi TaxID=228973 RepID=A0A4Q7M5N6_9MICO|nr:carbohydrate ABC transporter permease [Xylanibacterium ulmi]RZS61962.1 carbohydrate ABC transporter membrane protein 2 (CUT1 family) [Xylanibacterium ulmi]